MPTKKVVQPSVAAYEPVVIRPQFCSPEELDTHLEAFIKAFIAQREQERWLTYFVQKRSRWQSGADSKMGRKAAEAFEMFFALQYGYCHFFDGAAALPSSLARTYGMERGVYFDLREPPCKLTAAEAASLVLGKDGNRDGTAILSFVPGQRALFFSYEIDEGSQGIWKCERAV